MKKRIVYLDYLRVMATLAVIVLHIAAQAWNAVSGRSPEWNIFNFYDGIVRWGVPIFTMISGSIFLSREIDTKKIFSRYILRMLIAYSIWSVFYATAMPLAKFVLTGKWETPLKSIITNIIAARGHLWFIPMITGLYICLPITKHIVKVPNVTKYFLHISLIFAFILPQLINISNDFIGGLFAAAINKINSVIISKMHMHLVLGFSLYFILGHVLNNIELAKRQRTFIYILGSVGFLSTIVLNAIIAWKTNQPCETYFSNFSVNVLLEAVCVHTFFKYKDYNCNKINSIVCVLAKCSFGAYLIHIFVIEVLAKIGLNTLTFTPIFSIPIISFIVILISFSISWLLNKIPIVNKWIV